MKYTLGTICKLKGIDFEIVIIGYNGKSLSSNYVYEYIGCLYDEGFTGNDKLFRFNKEHIERILFEGYNKSKIFEEKQLLNQEAVQNENKRLEVNQEEKTETMSNSNLAINNENGEDEYIFDENGVLVEIRKAKQESTIETISSLQVSSSPVILQNIDIDSM